MIYPINPHPIVGREDCVYWENFLTDDDINYLLNRKEWADQNASCVAGTENKPEVNKSVRRSEVSWMGVDDENKDVWQKISTVIAKVNAQYFKYDITGFYEPAQLSTYSDEDYGCYDWHVDVVNRSAPTPRKLSAALLLSDLSEFEGGEFQLKSTTNTAKTLELAKGRVWIFPSYMLHRVAPVTKGVRKSLVLWAGGPDFK